MRYVAKTVGRIFFVPIFLIASFNNEGVVGFKVAEGLTALECSVSSSRHLWIPGLIEVDDDLMDWDHLNWEEEESLSTEYHPEDRVLLEYGTSGMKENVDSPSKGISLETSLEKKQIHRESTIYEGQWWQISSTPALPLEDAQPVWLSDSSQTGDMAQTSVATSFPYDNDMDAWPIRPRPSPLPVLFQDCNRSRQTCDGHGPESPIPNLIDSQCVEASPTPGEDVRIRAGMSSMSRVNVGKSSRMNQKLMALRFQIPRLSRKKSGVGRGIGTPSDRGLQQRTIAPRAADIHMLPPDSSILVGLQCYHSPNLEK